MNALSHPIPLSPEHDTDPFSCGVPPLDDWLKRQSRRNEVHGASRTFVACDGLRVGAYYCLAAGSMIREIATGAVRRNMPDPLPLVVIGRLAVDRAWQGRGIGAELLKDALLRSLGAADTIGIRAVLVHALSEDAKRFYERYGFQPSPAQPFTLMLMIAQARAMLG